MVINRNRLCILWTSNAYALDWTGEWTAQAVWINHFKMNSMDKDRLWPPSIISSSFHPPLLSFLRSFLFFHHFSFLFWLCFDFHYISFSFACLSYLLPGLLYFSFACSFHCFPRVKKELSLSLCVFFSFFLAMSLPLALFRLSLFVFLFLTSRLLK